MAKPIPIRVDISTNEAVSKGLFDKDSQSAKVPVDLAILKSNLELLRKDIADLLETEEEEAGFRLHQIEVGVEVSAEGGINLIGTLTAAGNAGIKLTFTRG